MFDHDCRARWFTVLLWTGLGVGWSAAARAQVTFIDRAATAGTSFPSFGRGAAMVDLDGDGRLDIIDVNDGMEHGFFRQLPGGTFQNMNGAWNIPADTRAHWGVLATDFDNDGDNDVYIINGGFPGVEANQMLRNDLSTSGRFTDVSAAIGDANVASKNFGGTAIDYDRDGDLDIFVTTTIANEHCLLFRNDGNLTFTDVSVAAGITQVDGHRHCSSGDYNQDGWPDIAVASRFGSNLLYRNNGDGTFTDVAAAAGVDDPQHNFGMVLEDFDNDGWQDVFIPKYQGHFQVTVSKMYKNDGDGTFTEVTADVGLTGQSDMGHSTGDVDGDGYPDIYIGTGHPDFEADDFLILVTPDGNGSLHGNNVSAGSGILSQGPTRCHGMAFGDYDRDGDIDITVNNGGPAHSPSTIEGNFLWENQGNGSRWVGLELTGVISNRSAVGAHAIATTSTGREVHRRLRVGHGFANTDSPMLHFGLGSDPGVQQIEIRWPSGIVQILLSPAMDAVTHVVETGMRLVGTPQIGTSVSLEFAGSPGHQAHLFFSAVSGSAPLPGFGGIWELGSPFFFLTALPLGTSGYLPLNGQVPDDPGLIGFTAYLQAWIHPVGSSTGSTLSNLVPLTFE